MAIDLTQYIATVPDYPEPGVMFRDISPLMADGEAYRYATDQLVDYARGKNVEMIVGPEARGFIVGCPVAYELGVGFAPARKEGSYPERLLKQRTALNMVQVLCTCTRMQSSQVSVS